MSSVNQALWLQFPAFMEFACSGMERLISMMSILCRRLWRKIKQGKRIGVPGAGW